MSPRFRSGPATVDYHSFPVVPVRIFLVDCEFTDKFVYDVESEHSQFPDDAAFEVELSLIRLDALALAVIMTVLTGEDAPFSARVSYAVEYEMDARIPEENREEEWRKIAYVVAPPLLYTYIREFYSNLTSRWRGGIVALPLLPLPLRFDEDERIVPEAPDNVVYQSALPLNDHTDSIAEVEETPREKSQGRRKRKPKSTQ